MRDREEVAKRKEIRWTVMGLGRRGKEARKGQYSKYGHRRRKCEKARGDKGREGEELEQQY